MKYLVAVPVLLVVSLVTSSAAEEGGLADGQLVYVPAYSHIYGGDREAPLLLTVTLSIRNIDPSRQVRISSIEYYETQGRLLKHVLPEPMVLNPLASFRYVVPERDETGGSGANFLIRWRADEPVNAPIIEAIMIGTKMNQGISFSSRGRAIVTPD